MAFLVPNLNADPFPKFFLDLITLILNLLFFFKFLKLLINWSIKVYELSKLPSSTKIISILKDFFFLKKFEYD